jgi:hypothetical protein
VIAEDTAAIGAGTAAIDAGVVEIATGRAAGIGVKLVLLQTASRLGESSLRSCAAVWGVICSAPSQLVYCRS